MMMVMLIRSYPYLYEMIRFAYISAKAYISLLMADLLAEGYEYVTPRKFQSNLIERRF